MAGVDKVANAVKGTLVAGGDNAQLEDPRPPFSVITNDGVSVAKSIMLKDPVEQLGANLMKEIGQKADKDGGDGTTTSITLAQAILHEGIALKESPMAIKKSLEECLPIIFKSIDDQTKPISVDEVGKVASISAEDEAMGAMIQEIYQKIGKDGILYPDISKTFSDYYTIGKGVKIDGAGFASPYMADTDESGRFTGSANYKNPSILITKQKIADASELNDLFATLYAKEVREVVVFCDEIEATVIPSLIMTRAKRGFKVLVVKLPVLWKDEWFSDLALMTGATIIDPPAGVSFKNMKLEHLGTCENIIVDKADTYLDGILDLDEHIAKLNEGSDEDKNRAARLNTKSARYFVGAPSDTALSYRRLKLEDARNAAWQALQGGIVPGGGVVLYNIALSNALPVTVGGKILKSALISPMRQIVENAGYSFEDFLKMEVPEDLPIPMLFSTAGFDARSGKIVDMLQAGIVDPARITKSSVQNAISVASTILTTRVIVTLPKVEERGPGIPMV